MYEELGDLLALADRVSGKPYESALRIERDRDKGWLVHARGHFGTGKSISDAIAELEKDLKRQVRERRGQLKTQLRALETDETDDE